MSDSHTIEAVIYQLRKMSAPFSADQAYRAPTFKVHVLFTVMIAANLTVIFILSV